jgi:hypothetical protein
MFRKLPEFRHFSTSSLGGAMSDNNPGSQGNSPYGQNPPQYGQNQPQYGQGPSPYGQQPYGSGAGNYPGQQGYPGRPADNPGRTLGIIGFILAILIAPVGLVISIVALVKSRRARMGNGFALAGIIIGALFTIGLILLFALFAAAAPLIQEVATACQGVEPGTTVTVQGQTVTCP